MLRATIVCLVALTLQISALPEYIENLDADLAALPTEYQHLGEEINAKRAAATDAQNNEAYCCSNWQNINNDQVFTKIQTSLVTQQHTVTIGYQDCQGNFNPIRPTVPPPRTTTLPLGGTTRPTTTRSTPIESTTGCTWTAVNKTETFLTTEYTVVTYMVPNSQTICAPEDYKCCPNYVMLNNNCVDASVVAHLEYLMQLGLIGNIGKK